MALTTTWPITGDGAGGVVFTANQWRTIVTALFTEGVLGSGSFVVSERAAGANMKLDITGGVAVITGDDASNQGRYLVREDSATLEAVTIDTADPSNPRHDLVGIQVNDPSEGGSSGRESVFAVVKGTAAASPSDPATPASFLVLARVVVPAGAVSITDEDIEDLRAFANLAYESQFGETVSTAGATLVRRRADGRFDAATPTGNLNVANKGYVDGLLTGAWTNVTKVNGWSNVSGYTPLRYRKVGDQVTLYGAIQNGSDFKIGELPAGYRPASSVGLPGTSLRVESDGDIIVQTTNATIHINMVYGVA